MKRYLLLGLCLALSLTACGFRGDQTQPPLLPFYRTELLDQRGELPRGAQRTLENARAARAAVDQGADLTDPVTDEHLHLIAPNGSVRRG